MLEPFELPVHFRGEDLSLPAQWIRTGYTHKFGVQVKDSIYYFEPDEEGSYRAIVEHTDMQAIKNADRELLQAIAAAIDEVLR
ncbi:MAG TPA: hypothetical protein VEY32_12415 [Flavisolibacter sp.]|jgi:hypothetical protein|nr:hypothetical protein [Flavisolibacter sp.]